MSPDPEIPAELAPKWHSIRPWNAQLSLYPREITSVSATFILSTEPNGEIEATTGFVGQNHGTDNSGNGKLDDFSLPLQDEGHSLASSSLMVVSGSKGKKSNSLLADIRLQVKVNGVIWQRVLIRIDDNGDEAVIIVYGLMPGREYDIDLGLVQPGQQPSTTLRRQVLTSTTAADEHSDPDSTGETSTDPDDHSNSSASDPPQALSTPSTSPSRTIPSTPPETPPPSVSLEDRLLQLRHTLSVINNERDTLLSSIKASRKDSQKADAALRAEIDALKRSSEKFTATEARTKQKILALQEAVKRAQAATTDIESEVGEMQNDVPGLLELKAAKEREYEKVKGEAERVRKTRDTEVEKERKRHESMRSELASLTNKLEKWTAKTEKHEQMIMPDLEQQLTDVQAEIEEEEKMLEQLEMNKEFEDVNRMVLNSVGQQSSASSQIFTGRQSSNEYPPYLTAPRSRHQSLNAPQSQGSGPGPISRPSLPAPIQRPSFSFPVSEFGVSRQMNHTTSLSLSSGTAFASQQLSDHVSTSSNIWSPPSRSTSGRSNSLQTQSSHQLQSQINGSSFVSSSGQIGSFRDAHSLYQNPNLQFQQSSQQVPTILTNLSRRGSLGPTTALPSSTSSTTRSSVSLSPTIPYSSAASMQSPPAMSASASLSSSTLSSRAPAFEPGRGRGLGLKILTSPISYSPTNTTAQGSSGNGRASGGPIPAPSPTRSGAPSFGVIGAGRR
ncbi:hypothetical protein FA15DRAFT_652788 [Coprinopsis marcescibilis]|uniref:Uncharacterized protein n=1 Tax=Coprinopsis marcescibilis TaxID=230819 RepID=A0A5C3L799_COPMA|nr:hypothetical protein FA15DRAFT_652788 [Coprinopsis marcescibilis]